VYFFKDEQVVTIFTYFIMVTSSSYLKFGDLMKWGQTNDPNYYLFHRMVRHPTSRYFVLNDKIQVLVDAGVLTLKSE